MYKRVSIISTILFIFFLLIIGLNIYNNNKEKSEERELISYFFNKTKISSAHKEDYIAVLEIPRISLKKGLYSINSKLNNVDKNIQILYESTMPDIKNGNFILASHSGTSHISYFKNLYKLKIGDISYVYYNNKKYKYKITNIYEVEKNGSIEIIRNNNKTTLTLITCNQKDKSKQIVFIFALIKTENY